ncbi:nuclease-related domain-containing protein [Vallitalea okinawensis]|uniref:nuclease-related domain-containing protein n=1 Tax=Vallitalea okinawensis TaxID=2078660 RepID=UPI000CFBD6B7|nr:nuclease-related domain-containing protein [Vallitalea okinawensis]
MARIKRKKNTIKRNIYQHYGIILLQILLSVIVVYFFVMAWQYGWLMLILLLIINVVLLRQRMKKVNVLKGGLKGEKEVLRLLKQLPRRYDVIVNKCITVRGKTIEYDFIIIGPTEVSIVEVKNYSGKLSGTIEGNQLTQSYPKQGRQSKQVKNPLKQLSRQEEFLRSYFNQQNIKYPIKGYLYFNNPHLQIQLNKWDKRIIQSEEKLLNKLKINKKRSPQTKKVYQSINYHR